MLQISDILARKDGAHQSELIYTIDSLLDNVNNTDYPSDGVDVTELCNDISSAELARESNNLKQKIKMPYKKRDKLSVAEKLTIDGKRKDGYSHKQVANILSRSIGTIRSYTQRSKMPTTCESKRGRKRKVTDTVKSHIIALVEEQNLINLTEIKDLLFTNFQISLSVPTISRVLLAEKFTIKTSTSNSC